LMLRRDDGEGNFYHESASAGVCQKKTKQSIRFLPNLDLV